MSQDAIPQVGDGGKRSVEGGRESRGESTLSSRFSNYSSSLHGEATRSLSSHSSSERSTTSSSPAPLHIARLSLSSSDAGEHKVSARAKDHGNSRERLLHSTEPAPVERVSHKAEQKQEARTLTSKQDQPSLEQELNGLKAPKSEGLPRVFLVEQQNKASDNKVGAPAQETKNEAKPLQFPIIDKTAAGDQLPKEKLQPGESPTIKVALSNPEDTEAPKPDFLVKKDGTVEMFSNPKQTGQKEIVIQYERNGDSTQLTDQQKAAGGALYTYLDAQLKQGNPQLQTKIDDSQGLLRDSQLPEDVKKNLENPEQKSPETQINPASGLPEKAGRTMQDTRRITDGPSTGSNVPRSDIDNMTPPVKRIPDEAQRMQAMKDTIASYTSRGEQKPYDYVSKRGDRGWGVGRYGMTYDQLNNWMSGLTDDQIAELIKQGKLTPDQAKNLKKMRDSIKAAQASGNDKDLDPFLQKMKNGEGTEDEMKQMVSQMLPDKVQELAASHTISKIAMDQSNGVKPGETGNADPGRVALSFVLGRNVSKEEAEGNADYRRFVESARQAYRMQENARNGSGPVVYVENMRQAAESLNKMVGEQFWREAAGATEYGNKGCAIAVTRALQRMGVEINTNLAVTNTMQDMRRRGWREVSMNEAIASGQLYVPVNKETGSHIGIGLGRQIWENSSGQRQFVTRDVGGSSLRHSGRAFIVPIQEKKAS
ncbi:MAG: hypothetical protein K2X77_07770 [Candidatus Obscuribacterales bacterium]|nr:hypothetical protein [Candidatus Obscuribacterales bacterium]